MSLTICAAALAIGIGSSAGAFDRPPDDTAQSPTAETTDGKQAAAAPKAPEAPPEGWRRERFALTRGKSRVEIIGYIQEDFRHFDWQVTGDDNGTKRAKERELRRIRIGSKARFGNLLLEITVDPRRPQTGSRLNTLAASYAFSRRFSLRVGLFKLPGSREFSTLTHHTDFVDRSMIATRLVPGRDWGVSVSGVLGRVEYLAGAFKGDGQSSLQRSTASGAGRVSVGLGRGFQLSGSFLEGRVAANSGGKGVAPLPKGGIGQTATGFTFWDRPYVDGSRRRSNGALSYLRGSFRFLGEYVEQREGRRGQGPAGQDVPDILGRGWSAQASYLLTGEKKGTIVEPRTSVFHGGAGAIELVARVEALKFDDTGDPSGLTGPGNRAGNLAPSGVSAIEAGVNYWPSSFMRLQTTAIWEKYNDPLIAPAPGDRGRYFSLLARVQFTIP